MYIISVDPGSKGALSIINCTDEYKVRSVIIKDIGIKNEKELKKYSLILELAKFIVENTLDKNVEPIIVVKEKTNAMPREGVSSARSFGWQSGILDGVFSTIRLIAEEAYEGSVEIYEVTPRVWQSELNLIYDKKEKPSKKEKKYNNFLRAIVLYPTLESEFRGVRGGLKDGRVDALLIGEYARRILKSGKKIQAIKQDNKLKEINNIEVEVKHTLNFLKLKKYKRKHESTELSRNLKKLNNMKKTLATIRKRYKIIYGS